MLPFLDFYWQFSKMVKRFDVLRRKGDSMANVFESLSTLEQRALGVTAWLTAHGNQLSLIAQQLESVKNDVADIFKQIQDIKQEVKGSPK